MLDLTNKEKCQEQAGQGPLETYLITKKAIFISFIWANGNIYVGVLQAR
jgi:hypothetical protein